MKTIEESAKEYAELKANPIFRNLEVSIAEKAFKAGAEFVQQVISEKESKNCKSYSDGLEDMLNAAIDNYRDDYDYFLDNIHQAKDKLLDEFTKRKK